MRTFFIFTTIFFTAFSFSQKQNGKVTLIDGKVIYGLVDVGGGFFDNDMNTIFFKENKDSKTIKYNEKSAKSAILINNKNEEAKFEFVFVEYQKKALLLKVEIDGFLKLYSDSNSYFNGTGFRNSSTFHIKKETETLAQYFVAFGYIPKKGFKKVVKFYFIDCPEIQNKVEVGKFKSDDFNEIVNFYNLNCAPK